MLTTSQTKGTPQTIATIKAASTAGAQAAMDIAKIESQWDAVLRSTKQDRYNLLNDARKVSIAQGPATTVKRMNRMGIVTAPLVEGETPKSDSFSFDAMTITTAEYGNYIVYTNQTDKKLALGKITTQVMGELRNQAYESLERIVFNTLVAQGSPFYANGKANKDGLAVGDIATMMDFFTMRNSILDTYGKDFNGKIKVYSDHALNDILLKYDPVVAAFMDFGNTNALLKSAEVVDLLGLMFVFSRFGNAADATIKETNATGVEIMPALVYGKNSFLAAQQGSGYSVQMIWKGLGSAGTSDPLNQRGTIGWYIGNFGVKVRDTIHVWSYWFATKAAAGADAKAFSRRVQTV